MNHPFLKKMGIMTFDTNQQQSAIISPHKCMQCHSSERCLFSLEKNLWHRILYVNKKHVPLKSYSLKKKRIDSVNQILILSIKSWGTKKKLHKLITKIYWPELGIGRFRVYIILILTNSIILTYNFYQMMKN